MTFTQADIVQLVCTQADTVFCTDCLAENQEQDPRDENPNNWQDSYIPWHPEQPCEQCGRTSPWEGLPDDQIRAIKMVRQQTRQPSPYLPDTWRHLDL